MHIPSLSEAFLSYFDVKVADTTSLRNRVDRVRYRVYCEEFGYEDSSNFPEHQEVDEFDRYSLHCLVTHRRSGIPAGCVRLVCASENHQLPLEKYCLGSMHIEYMDALRSEPDKVCEFSRLAVDTAFRRRRGEDHTRIGEFDAMDCSHQERRTFSLIGVTAFIAAVALAELTNRTQIFGMMESNLPRLLRRSGLLVQQAGEYMDYHGQRAPYYLTTELALENMRQDLRVLYDEIHGSLSQSIIPKEFVA